MVGLVVVNFLIALVLHYLAVYVGDFLGNVEFDIDEGGRYFLSEGGFELR